MTARAARLAATTTVAAGLAGIAATASGWMSGADGTLLFPAAVIVGAAALRAWRPRRTTRPHEGGGSSPERRASH